MLSAGQRSSQRQFSSQPPHIHRAADEDAGDAGKENGDERADRDEENVDDGEEEEEYQARLQRVKFSLHTAESLHSQHGTKKIPRKKGERLAGAVLGCAVRAGCWESSSSLKLYISLSGTIYLHSYRCLGFGGWGWGGGCDSNK